MSGADAADKEIIERMHENDIVITQDIPLAAQVIEKRRHCYSSQR